MAETLTDAYATLDDLKLHLNVTEASKDDLLTRALNASSRRVDEHCHRRFTTDTSATARKYVARQQRRIRIDDFYETTALVVKTDATGDGTFDTTWVTSDYQLEPLDGIVDGRPGFPYWRIRAVGNNRFPIDFYGQARVEVTAKWGWSAAPDDVEQATLLLAAQLYRLKDSPLGVAGESQHGVLRVRDVPHAKDLLIPFVRKLGFA